MKDDQIKKPSDDNTAEYEKKMRREFIKYAGLGASGLALSACAMELEKTPSTSRGSGIARARSALSRYSDDVASSRIETCK